MTTTLLEAASRISALIVFMIVLASCSVERTTRTLPNIMLITLDTTRADHLGCYGYFRDTSPNIDELAQESILFDRCIVPMAVTLPTHVSILTATYPLEHGVLANIRHGNRRFVPSPELRSFATICKEAGYQTAAFVSAVPLKRGTGVENGFDTFDQPSQRRRSGEKTTSALLAWLSSNGNGPLFIWIHYFDAHFPYMAPPPFNTMYRTDEALDEYLQERHFPETFFSKSINDTVNVAEWINTYDGEIRYQDEQIGRILAELRSRPDWENSVILLMGDHGEGLSQHGMGAHGGTWHEQLHTPMMIHSPGQPPHRISKTVSAVDAIPTLLGLIDIPELNSFLEQATGRDVLTTGAQSMPALSQDTKRYENSPYYRYTLTSDTWKYFLIEYRDGTTSEELYNLENDRYELKDVSEEHGDICSRLNGLLRSTIEKQARRGTASRDRIETPSEPVDSITIEQLKGLGYIDDEEEGQNP